MSKKTFEIAKETQNDLLVQVKDNQKELLTDCKWTTQCTKANATYQTEEKGHGRIEIRETKLYKDTSLICDLTWQGLLAIIIVVHRIRMVYDTKQKEWKSSEETSYYVCNNKKYSVKEFGETIRNHWGIENSNHYVKDVSMREDNSKIRKNAGIMARFRSFVLNILRADNTDNINQALYRNSINSDRLYSYKYIFD